MDGQLGNFFNYFEVIRTKDNSPSLRPKTSSGGPLELMHSHDGALSETLYIYGKACERLFEILDRPQILSVGLGLGYNELLTAALSLKYNKKFELLSFESEELLKESFKAWLLDKSSPLTEIYNEILLNILSHLKMPNDLATDIKNQLLNKDEWQLYGTLSPNSSPKPVHGILYDAYSSKSTPELWTEEFLFWFLENFSQKDCLFVTYAATGVLNRILKNASFKRLNYKGFCSKREATWAVKGDKL